MRPRLTFGEKSVDLAGRCGFMVGPRKGGGPTERMFLRDFGGGWPLRRLAGPPGETTSATPRDGSRELVPPGEPRRPGSFSREGERFGAPRLQAPRRILRAAVPPVQWAPMDRPTRFEHHRWV